VREIIKNCILDSIQVKKHLINDDIINKIENIVNKSIDTFNKGNKFLICGNGGSAADAQHIAAELSGRFYIDRKPLFAEALHVNSSFITAVANDYGYSQIYSRMVESAGRKDDILMGISTSGNSENIINALKKAKEIGMFTIGLSGNDVGGMYDTCDVLIRVPSSNTPRIQESHILIGHIICQLIEEKIFG
tara:strand:+ start:50950 stop:51522 length:573 start_codon:yes stop_codon:yes gene_type:complete